MIDPDTLTEIRQFCAKYGPGNCWTGTVGQACVYLRMLLDELEPQSRERQAELWGGEG
jgi:hypothetical protein